MSIKSLFLPELVKENKEFFDEHLGETESALHKISFTWTIYNFSFQQQDIGEMLQSPIFSADSCPDIKWCLKLYPKGESEEFHDYVSINLILVSNPCEESKVFAKYEMSILSAKPSTTHTLKLQEALHFKIDSCYGYPEFIKRSTLLDSPDLLSGDKLSILCKVSFLSHPGKNYSEKITVRFEYPDCCITNDLENLIESQKFCDVILEVDDYEFPAHRAILAARSVVFDTIFRNGQEMEDSKPYRIKIRDVNHQVVRELLHYIYTGNAPNLDKMANQLLVAAEKYALKELKVMSEEALFDSLSMENAAEILILAQLYNADQLKKRTIEFINRHVVGIIKTNGWKTLETSHEHLAIETLKRLL